ncbi:MAG: RHS repeat-associated core domain-containing protein [Thermoanaerobaculia bacterium]
MTSGEVGVTPGTLRAALARFSGSPIYAVVYTRDDAGRIVVKRETIQGVTTVYEYQYDTPGRLRDVLIDGVQTSYYEHDANGNRTLKTSASGTETASCDGQDRIVSYGDATFTYTANGELLTQTDATGTTTYTYDALSNLTKVVLPDSTVVEYVIDGQNRRVGEKVNGALTKGWLYGSQLSIAAELDATGAVVSRFDGGLMLRGGVTYRILTDHLGSPRLVVNSATGAVVQRLDYNEFGVVLSESNPGFVPLGFAGGLYDTDTALVRFGSRDYSAAEGRWTAKDPILFDGGDRNLYGYAFNDPLNFLDPSGLANCKVPKGPPRANVVKNSLEAEDKGVDDARWWFNQVRNKGPWDYKQQGSQYEEFGNFNYGATGAAMGIPDQVLLRAAGYFQPRKAWLPYFGRWWSGAPYGDDPADQVWIQQGIEYYRNSCSCSGGTP